MLKFVKGNLENIDGVALYPIISLLIFFIFFVALFWWVITVNKKYVGELSELPLDKEPENQEL